LFEYKIKDLKGVINRIISSRNKDIDEKYLKDLLSRGKKVYIDEYFYHNILFKNFTAAVSTMSYPVKVIKYTGNSHPNIFGNEKLKSVLSEKDLEIEYNLFRGDLTDNINITSKIRDINTNKNIIFVNKPVFIYNNQLYKPKTIVLHDHICDGISSKDVVEILEMYFKISETTIYIKDIILDKLNKKLLCRFSIEGVSDFVDNDKKPIIVNNRENIEQEFISRLTAEELGNTIKMFKYNSKSYQQLDDIGCLFYCNTKTDMDKKIPEINLYIECIPFVVTDNKDLKY